MQVLVTGGTGLLGRELLKQLVAGGFQVKALYRSEKTRSQVGEYAKLVDWVKGDLLDFPTVDVALNEVDTVFHCAGIVSFDPKKREELEKVNVRGTRTLLDLSLHHKIKRFVHVSSTAALGRAHVDQIIDENTIWEPSSNNSGYAISKYNGEMEAWRAYAEGLPVVVVNPSVILGNGSWDKGSSRLFKLNWVGNKFYTSGVNGYVDVLDVARIMILLAKSEVSGERFIISAENLSYKHLFSKISHHLEVPGPYIKATKWMRNLAWLVDNVGSKIRGGSPGLTREVASITGLRVHYCNSKIKNWLGYEFKPIDHTIKDICRQFLTEHKSG